MTLYDISMTISEDMAVYKNRPAKKPLLKNSASFENSTVYETRLDMDLHTGTHIDMPLHLLPGGATSDQWQHSDTMTCCLVLDFSAMTGDALTAELLGREMSKLEAQGLALKSVETVLLKTKNSFSDRFDFNFIYLDRTGAEYLAEKRFRGVGIDALGIERDQPGHETHKTLLGAGIWILEGLRLQKVPPGLYTLMLFPLKIKGVEAMPARAVLLEPGCENLPGN